MNGVEILSQEIIYNTLLPWWIGALCFFGIIVFVVLIAISAADCNTGAVIIFVICAALCVVALPLSIEEFKCAGINHIRYEVTIDDFVSMTSFMDKYEILDQRGKIYTVREKIK